MRRPLIAAFLVLAATPALAPNTVLGADPGEMQRKDGLRDAVSAPLEDLNLKQVAIPAVLQRARAAPYDIEGLKSCEAIAGEIGRLDAALGADLDEAPPPDRRTRTQKVASAAHDAGVAEVKGRARDLIPFRGWVRKLTGAARHDKAVVAAIHAGGVRRGYLKGVGMDRNCAPPAAPGWFVPKHEATGFEAFCLKLVAWFKSWWPF